MRNEFGFEIAKIYNDLLDLYADLYSSIGIAEVKLEAYRSVREEKQLQAGAPLFIIGEEHRYEKEVKLYREVSERVLRGTENYRNLVMRSTVSEITKENE